MDQVRLPATARTAAAVLLLGLSASCRKSTSLEPPRPPPLAPAQSCTSEFPGLPLAELPPPARAEFCRFAKDTLCYCGCPHSLAGCLKNHPSCPHASRMAAIALGELAMGATAERAEQSVSAYYDSFKPGSRVHFDVARLPCMGSPDAKVTLVEFSDFDCPHCREARPLLENTVQKRSDVRLCFMPFPIHPHSMIAAEAATYAVEKGDFWKLHDLLFDDQAARASLDEMAYTEEILRLGEKAGLDRQGLVAALHDEGIKAAIEKEQATARTLGVDGTPFIFLNGRPLPPITPELLDLTIGDELEWISHGGAWAKDKD